MTGSELNVLLAETISRYISAEAHIVDIRSRAVATSSSGGEFVRHEVTYRVGDNRPEVVRLVTKLAGVVERKAWRLLNCQGQPSVPFSHALDYSEPEKALICLEDVGDERRPTSLEPITEQELTLEATGLASIHLASLGKGTELDWLPRIDRAYVEWSIDTMWRPTWTKVRTDATFIQTFEKDIPMVEATATSIIDDVGALVDQDDSLTLIHNDINPSNVLVRREMPFYIDWQTAAYGPWYLDLPHHFCNLRQAEHYRKAIAQRGASISAGIFAEHYRVAARYIGLRYMWWTLQQWQADHNQTAWVRHYLGLISGHV